MTQNILHKIAFMAAMTGAVSAMAAVPAGYYDSLGGKSGEELQAAVRALGDGHTRISYGDNTWSAFEQTDVRTVNGRAAWWDMYSNNLVYVGEHAAMNIEHSVANSWWGGEKNDAYSDLFHLNPSDQNANNKKGNYPPGRVGNATLLDNGVLRIGTPAEGSGGGAKNVFEPADEYKGDFARAYFYIFATYGDLEWKSEYAFCYDTDGKMQPWLIEMLSEWAQNDPVDTKESRRNDAIYALQNNRNPFIDCPELYRYIWGDRSGQTFTVTAEPTVTDRPEAPVFDSARTVGVNTYSRRWWDGIEQTVGFAGGTLMLSVDGSKYYESDGHLIVDPAGDKTSSHTYRAYVKSSDNGLTLNSSTSTLTVTAIDPSADDCSLGNWEPVLTTADIRAGERYIILSGNTRHSMSTTGGTSSTAFMQSAGFVEFSNTDVTELPVDAAIIRFEDVTVDGNSRKRLEVEDVLGNYRGSWHATAKNKMKLESTAYTPGVAEIDSNGTFVFTFDQYGSLQFNKTQPRFLNYESKQTPVLLYRLVSVRDWTGIGSIGDEEEERWSVGQSGNNVIVPEHGAIYDLNGRRVEGRGLRPGVYVITGSGHAQKIVIR